MTRLTLEREDESVDVGPRTSPHGQRLDRAEPGALWGEYTSGSVGASRDELVLHYAPLVRLVAGRLGTGLPAHIELADLVQSGVFGLFEAIERFEPDMGVRFEVYAAARIRGAILDELRAQDWVPRLVRGRARQLASARERVEARIGRGATRSDLARELGVTAPQLPGAPARLLSIEAMAEQTGGSPASLAEAELEAGAGEDPAMRHEAAETIRLLGQSLGLLGERDRLVLRLSFVEDLTLADIGARLGVTESGACRLRGRAVARLRQRFAVLTGSETVPAPATVAAGAAAGTLAAGVAVAAGAAGAVGAAGAATCHTTGASAGHGSRRTWPRLTSSSGSR